MRTWGRIPNPAYPAILPKLWSVLVAYAAGNQVLATDGLVYTALAGSTGVNPAGYAAPAVWTITKPLLWVMVQTDANGFDDWVWVTTLIQVLKLNLNESPFYAEDGLPAKQSIIQQVAPDFYIARIQQKYAQHFASLLISRVPATTPTYNVQVTTNQGASLSMTVQVPA
jgi:hypothetical protein